MFKRQELLEISAAPVPLHPLTLANRPALPQVEHSGEGVELLRELTGLWKDLGQLASNFVIPDSDRGPIGRAGRDEDIKHD